MKIAILLTAFKSRPLVALSLQMILTSHRRHDLLCSQESERILSTNPDIAELQIKNENEWSGEKNGI